MEKRILMSMPGRFFLVVSVILGPGIGRVVTPARAGDAPEANKPVDLTWGVKIPMRDDVRLNATLYKPHAIQKPLPVIVTMTPYISDSYHDRAMYFARNGYIFALVDVRGRGNAEGKFAPFENDSRDGHDVVEWLAKQSWCNGKVGMWGGSYAGFNQWATLKEFPPHLSTIVPAAAAHPGVDFPGSNNIFPSYLTQWLTFTAGVTPNVKLFGDLGHWKAKFGEMYTDHLPFCTLDTLVGNPSPRFQKWLQHRTPDDYLDAMVPTVSDYARLDIPILTITGHYDDDQPGALTYYRRHMQHGSDKGRAKHYLLVGPWDHAGTRTPAEELGGLKFGKASMMDLNHLHREWYDWTLKDGPRPKLDRVTYYVAGEETWKYASSLDAIPGTPEKLYLTCDDRGAKDVFHSGTLCRAKPEKMAPAQYTYDPLDPHELISVSESSAKNQLVDQSLPLAISGNGLVYHSEPFTAATEITGLLKLALWIKLDVRDTDFAASLFEIKPDGASIALTDAHMRARYRDSQREPHLVQPEDINRYEMQSFLWFSRRLEKGSRLRLVLYSPNSRNWEKNYNSGKEVSTETAKDARTAHITVYQDGYHASYLEIPTVSTKH